MGRGTPECKQQVLGTRGVYLDSGSVTWDLAQGVSRTDRKKRHHDMMPWLGQGTQKPWKWLQAQEKSLNWRNIWGVGSDDVYNAGRSPRKSPQDWYVGLLKVRQRKRSHNDQYKFSSNNYPKETKKVLPFLRKGQWRGTRIQIMVVSTFVLTANWEQF